MREAKKKKKTDLHVYGCPHVRSFAVILSFVRAIIHL